MKRRRPMIEALRERRKAPAVQLRCFRCGLTRELADDGRRVHYAQMHVTACTSAAPEPGVMRLINSNHLEVVLEDGTTWIQIRNE